MIVIMTINFNCNRSCVFSPSLTAIVIVTATVIMTATVHDCDYGCHCNCDCGCDSFDCHCDCEFNRYSFVIISLVIAIVQDRPYCHIVNT